jgi:hypothetical protein
LLIIKTDQIGLRKINLVADASHEPLAGFNQQTLRFGAESLRKYFLSQSENNRICTPDFLIVRYHPNKITFPNILRDCVFGRAVRSHLF